MPGCCGGSSGHWLRRATIASYELNDDGAVVVTYVLRGVTRTAVLATPQLVVLASRLNTTVKALLAELKRRRISSP
jgi:hypothetical protein